MLNYFNTRKVKLHLYITFFKNRMSLKYARSVPVGGGDMDRVW